MACDWPYVLPATVASGVIPQRVVGLRSGHALPAKRSSSKVVLPPIASVRRTASARPVASKYDTRSTGGSLGEVVEDMVGSFRSC